MATRRYDAAERPPTVSFAADTFPTPAHPMEAAYMEAPSSPYSGEMDTKAANAKAKQLKDDAPVDENKKCCTWKKVKNYMLFILKSIGLFCAMPIFLISGKTWNKYRVWVNNYQQFAKKELNIDARNYCIFLIEPGTAVRMGVDACRQHLCRQIMNPIGITEKQAKKRPILLLPNTRPDYMYTLAKRLSRNPDLGPIYAVEGNKSRDLEEKIALIRKTYADKGVEDVKIDLVGYGQGATKAEDLADRNSEIGRVVSLSPESPILNRDIKVHYVLPRTIKGEGGKAKEYVMSTRYEWHEVLHSRTVAKQVSSWLSYKEPAGRPSNDDETEADMVGEFQPASVYNRPSAIQVERRGDGVSSGVGSL